MMRRLVLGFCLVAGCGGPAFESEAVELEYLEALSNPTREQFLRRKQLHAAAVEEKRRRDTPEARFADPEDQAAYALEVDYEAAEARGMTPEAARAVYRSIIKRYPGTRTAAKSQERLDNLGSP